ncbi:forkhead box protein M1 isoform X2 [Lissotriton helveticus]
MRTSPRRPLILKRRKLSLPVEDAAASQDALTKNEIDDRCKSVPSGRHGIDADSDHQKFPAGIKIVNHPSMPNTQVVFIPKHANVQNIIAALTAKGKECGSTGPNKFILISGGGALRQACPSGVQEQADKETSIEGGGFGDAGSDGNICVSRNHVDLGDGMLLHTATHITPNQNPKSEEENSTPALTNCLLDESLTNIQWLGKMSSDGLGSCTMRQELEDKENLPPVPQGSRGEEDVGSLPCGSSFTSWQESISERPPYSYMAMIQFAINSTDRKRMTLKEIYTWIEDHFPYFKHVAKPGWKNSIRHNLSLHDMFVRETSANGKISFWTIHPDANRCLTLDQVFKPMDQSPLMQVLPCDPQQKRLLPELQKCVAAGSGVKSESLGTSVSTERKMKLLLPRVNSYFVPVHFPLSQQFLQQPSGKMPLSPSPSSSVSNADLTKNKNVQIVPKPTLQGGTTSTYLPLESTKEKSIVVNESSPSAVIKDEEDDESLLSSLKENTSYTSLKPSAWQIHDVQMSTLEESSQSLPLLSVKEENPLKGKRDCQFTVLRDDVPLSSWKEERTFTAAKSPARKLSDMQVIRRRKSSSRRKQHLIIPRAEEPLLVFPDCNNSDSGLVSDFSFLQETQTLEHPTDLSSAQDTCPFKTPIKEKLIKMPVSSTPSKPVRTTPQAGGSEPWRVTSLNKEGTLPDFSPVRLPPGTTLTPFKDSLDLLGFSSPPFHDVPLFESPQQLLNNKSPDMTPGPFASSPTLELHSAKRCSKELPIGNLTNRSLTEGLVLDTMNDSLSKILLDISFTGLEEDDRFDGDNVSWSQFIPELR